MRPAAAARRMDDTLRLYDWRMQPKVLIGASLAVLLLACGSGGGTTGTPAPATPTPTRAAPTPSTPTEEYLGVPVPVAGSAPTTGVPWYLAIGDSITFGYSVDIARTGINSSWARQLQDLLARSGRAWRLFDTACPGETTDTYFGRCPLAHHDIHPTVAGHARLAQAALAALPAA